MVKVTFGEQLKRIRTQKRYSVRKVALFSGISSSYYSQVENNKRQIPKPETLRKIAKGLNITTNEIFTLAGLIPNNSDTFDSNDNLTTDKATVHELQLLNSSIRLQIPASRRVYSRLPHLDFAAAQPQYFWLKVADNALITEGITMDSLVVISTDTAICNFSDQHRSKLVALNLDSRGDTVIRRVIWGSDHQYFILNGPADPEPVILEKTAFDKLFAGVVVNLHREIDV
ncbi:helix-turn-helix domain-containing protein [Lactiplantibacillus herbarum]|uniref:helix-turn-helix domain-containing protein n=1 Tax=Lactiplantibacillus herbarum TaxID=1670446 RepID=UPI00069F08F3|nr:helix-turn-helix transcriptional regulator [Lactiplantibacillus herbarum]